MADDSEKWLQRKKLYQQSSKDRWPCGDTDSPGSPDRSGRREGDEESHKPSSAELLKRGSEGGAAREGRPSQAWSPSPGRGSKREGSGSSAHLVSTGPESSLDLGSMTGQEGGQSREESSWVDLGHSSEMTPHETEGHKENLEPALRALKKAKDETKQQLDVALQENTELRQQIETARARAHEVTESVKVSSQKELEHQKQELRDAEQRHQYEIKRLREDFAQKLHQKDRERPQDQNSALQDLEAHYQGKLREQERMWHRREQEYRGKIAELESYQQQMTRKEFEVRAETERLQEELGQKEMELSMQLQQSFRSGQGQVGGTEPPPIGGMPEDLGGARRLQREVDLKDIEIETLHDQLEKMKERVSILNEVIHKNTETAKRGLRSGDVDQYTEQVTRLTEQLSQYDTANREQKKELAKLRQKVESFGEIERQLESATVQMSRYEFENQSLRQKMTDLELTTASGGIVGGDTSKVARLESELQRLRPLEGEVQRLNEELESSKHYHGLAKDFQLKISALKREVQQKADVIAQIQSQTPREPTNPAKTEAEMVFLRKQLATKEEEITRLRSERLKPKASGKPTVDSVTVQELAGQLAQVRKEVAMRDREITRLKTERARLEASGSVSDGVSHSPLESHQVKELHRLLKEKDDKITKLTEQLQQFERTATDLTKIVQHSKDQSRVVMELKEQLERSESQRSLLQSQRGHQEVVEVPSAAAPSEIESLQKRLESSLVATQSENQTLVSRNMQIDQQLRQLKVANAQLQGEVASLRGLQREASMAAELARERDHLQQKTIHMQAKLQNLEQDLLQSKQQFSHSGDTVREQGREIQRLTAENLELRNDLEIERVKAVTFQEDFQQERRDRESAHTKVAEMETRYTHQLQTMGEELHRTHTELDAHKQNLSNTEAVMQKRTQQARQQLADKEREVGRMNQEVAHLCEEVQSKTQQVKQYKKQVDQYRQEMEPLKQQATILKEQVEFFACKTDEMNKQNVAMKQELETLRRERDRSAHGRGSPSGAMTAELQREVARREVFERRTAELERENDCFRHDVRALQMENDQLKRRLGFDPGRQDLPPRPAFAPPPSSNLAPPPRSPPMVHHSASVESSQRLGQTYPPVVDPHTRQAQRQLPPKGYSFDDQRMAQSRVSSTDQLPAPTRSAAIRPTGANTLPYYSHSQPPAPNGFSSRGTLPPTKQGPWTTSTRGNFNGQAPPHHHASSSRNEGLGPMGVHSSGLASLPSGLGTNEYQQMSTPRYHDDSKIYPSPDTVEKDSPPTSNVGSQAQQLQQQYQLQQQLAMHANSGRSNASHTQRRNHDAPSNAHPHLPLGQRSHPEHPPLSSPPHYKPQAALIHSKAGATSPILTFGDQSTARRPVAQASKYPVQETQPVTKVSRLPPSMRTTYTFGSSQPVPSNATVAPKTASQSRVNSDQESNSLLQGIDSEIHQAAKNIKTKVGDDLSLPASGDDVPFDRNLVCPVCRVQFRLGEIQKFRKHVEICHKTKK